LLPLDPLSPSSNLSNGVFVSEGVANYGIGPLLQPSSSSFKGKIAAQTEEKSCGKTKGREQN